MDVTISKSRNGNLHGGIRDEQRKIRGYKYFGGAYGCVCGAQTMWSDRLELVVGAAAALGWLGAGVDPIWSSVVDRTEERTDKTVNKNGREDILFTFISAQGVIK